MRKGICILVFLLTTVISFGQNEKAMKNFDSNFAHTVFFWFKNPDHKEDRIKFEKSLQKFLDNSAYAKTNFIGTPPKATREVVDDSFTYSLVVTFASAEDQEAYQSEAPHLLFIEECKALWEKVIVYDANGIK